MSYKEAEVRQRLAEKYRGITVTLSQGYREGEVVGNTEVKPEAWGTTTFDEYSRGVNDELYGESGTRGRRKV